MSETASDVRKPSFTFPRVRQFTGKIQYRVDDMESINSPFGVVKRGEVKEVTNKGTAVGLVENGDFTHVAADTPVGVPQSVIDEHSPKKKTAAPEPQQDEQKNAGADAGAGNGAPPIVPNPPNPDGNEPAKAD